MYVFGKNVAMELLKNNKEIHEVFIYKDFTDKSLIYDLQKRNINIKFLEKHELDRLVKTNHQGIILNIPDYQYSSLNEMTSQENAFLVILDHLEDPHNLGAIIRTSEAFGVDGIIIPKNRSVSINSTVMKVSSGALDNVKIAEVTNLSRTINDLKKEDFWIVGTDLQGDNYSDIDYKGKIAIVIGNEGKGLGRLVKEQCDFIATIPMTGEINSLNASVAAGIIISYANLARR